MKFRLQQFVRPLITFNERFHRLRKFLSNLFFIYTKQVKCRIKALRLQSNSKILDVKHISFFAFFFHFFLVLQQKLDS